MACDHLFIVSGWKTSGLYSTATHYNCSKCLISSEERDKNGLDSRENKKANARSVSNKDNLHLPGEASKAD